MNQDDIIKEERDLQHFLTSIEEKIKALREELGEL